MKTSHHLLPFFMGIAFLPLASCNKMDKNLQPPASAAAATATDKMVSENGTNPDELALQSVASLSSSSYLYTESNAKGGNSIIEFTQTSNGSLINRNEFASGGSGTGEALNSQGALCISRAMNLLFAVNAGSGTISSFRIHPNGSLQLLFTLSSNGVLPRSLAMHGNILYVLNNESANICGFTVEANGFFSKIAGSIHNLSSLTGVDAPQIGFAPDGKAVYVTEKVTNLIDKFDLDNTGAITSVKFIPSTGVTPFGFDFSLRAKAMVVTNAAEGGSGAGSCTSYQLSGYGGLKAVNGAVGNFETSPCWLATTRYGAFAFVSNTSTNNISSYYVDTDGAITLLKPVAAQNGSKPIDIAVSYDDKYVYNINSASYTLSEYKRLPGGALQLVGTISTLPQYAVGLVSY